MTDNSDSPLQRLLGTAALSGVRQRLRRHFERIAPDAPPGHLRLADLDPAAHTALCQLTGRPSRAARSMMLDIADLDARLHASGLADSLRDALQQLDGPIVAQARLRRDLQSRWLALAATEQGDSRLQAWLRTPSALTLLKRVARDPDRAARLLANTDAVLRQLPAAGVTRSQLAATTLGDAHALDAGRPAATLALAAWRHGERTSSAPGDEDEGKERARDTWAQAGVLVNELARPALFLNLPHAPDAAGGWMAGEPMHLSLRNLLRRPPVWRVAGCRIFVCENPDIVAIAAEMLGAASAPLVCTEGMPAAAQRTLLDQLAGAGAQLHYHGDYDWAGIVIGNFVMRTWNAAPWRFGAADYLLAVEHCARTEITDLSTSAVEASWDAALCQTMSTHGVAVAEEAVVEALLEDLRQRPDRDY